MNEPSPLDHGSSAPLPQNSATGNEESIEVTLRLDGPHSQPGGPAPHAERLETAAVRNFPAREIPLESMGGLDVAAESAVTTSAPPPRNEAFRLQTETGQIAAYLKQQYADIERREARLHAQFAQSDQERRDQRLWINQVESQLAERERALAEKEDALATQVTTCEALDRELRELQETLLRERHAFDVERQEWERTRDEQIQVIEAMRAKQQIELDRLRAETLAELGAAETELKQKAVLLDNRHRFQQEHLQRLMQDFEIQQNEFRREQQMLRTQAEAERQQNWRRGQQIDQRRVLLDERQQSVERERQILTRERRSLEERLALDAEHFRQERAAWEQERETQKADLRRQQDLLTLHAENLEARRQRLDRLRSELEETNRHSLEMRLAVEESVAQLLQTAGTEAARERIDEAHAVLAEYYRHTRESIIRQHQELEQVQQRIQEQRTEFRNERQLLVTWATQQEEQFAARDQALHAEREALEHRFADQQRQIASLTAENLRAESRIRELLNELAERDAE